MPLDEESAEEVSTEVTAEAESQVVEGMEQEYTSIDDLRNIGEVDDEIIETQADESEAEAEEATEVDGWKPDYTYKVKDEVLEFDEALREAVGNKEVEDHLRDLYTKSAGLDGYKTKNSELETQVNEMTPQLTQLVDGYKNIKYLRETKDFDRLISVLGWGEEDLLDYAEKLLERQELPAEQQTALTTNRALEDKVNLMESQLSNYDTQSRDEVVAKETAELDGILSSDAYSAGVAVLKEVGLDFKQEVIKLGKQEYQQSNGEIYPDMADVISRVYESRRPIIERLSVQTNELPTNESVEIIEKKATLPKINGTNNNKIEETMTFERLKELSSQIPTR
jgi:hypothetical protein